MKKSIITFGVYDFFHLGHLRLFKNIKKMCGQENHLIVAVQDSDYILKYKPTAKILYTTEERKELIRSLREVDEVITYEDVDKSIQTVDFDIFAKGPDQVHAGFERATKYALDLGREVVVIPRTEGISSSALKSIPEDLKREIQG